MFKYYGLKSTPNILSDPPFTYANVVWFQDARPTSVSKCSKCPAQFTRCPNCQKKFDGEVLLITEVSYQDTQSALKKVKMVPVKNFTEMFRVCGREINFEIFSPKRIRYLENKYDTNVIMYIQNNEETVALRKPLRRPFSSTINLMMSGPLPDTKNGLIENFSLINDEKLLPKFYVCEKTKGCRYTSYSRQSFDRHSAICGISNVKQIRCKQVAYGDDSSVLKEMVGRQLIPNCALQYRNTTLATWDIETIEEPLIACAPKIGLSTNANLRLLSIAVGSNIPGYEPKCWVRRNMEADEETRLIYNFVDEILFLQKEKLKTLPAWIDDGLAHIDLQCQKLKERKAKWNEYLEWTRYRRELEKFVVLDVFGYNCGKFDIPCIAGPLFSYLQEKCRKITVLKKMSSYIVVATDVIRLKDALRFTAPCSYDKFARVWEAPTSKSIWPYSFYNTVEEMRAAKKFPPISAFESTLKGNEKPKMDIYIEAKTEFYRRKLLPKRHPDKINSMYGFLKYYNKQDVQPLAQAIENCFACYDQHFKVNAMTALSLPGLAMNAMFKNYKVEDPLIYSFSDKYKYINEIFRSNVYGGLVNVFTRHVCTYDTEKPIPHAARYAPNGQKFSSIISLDFTSMYLTCQGKEMPTSPGIIWEKADNGKYTKNIMCDGHSFKAQQWLCYRQETGT